MICGFGSAVKSAAREEVNRGAGENVGTGARGGPAALLSPLEWGTGESVVGYTLAGAELAVRWRQDMQAGWLMAGAVYGFIAVAAGAFGAHALNDLPEKYRNAFEVGARYQMYHALALVLVALLPRSKWTLIAAWCFLLGTLVFSGTLYALALTKVRWLGAITPIGGVGMLVGWVMLVLAGVVYRGAPSE